MKHDQKASWIVDTVAGRMKVEMTVDPEVTLATAVSAPPLPSSCPRDDTLHLTTEGGKWNFSIAGSTEIIKLFSNN